MKRSELDKLTEQEQREYLESLLKTIETYKKNARQARQAKQEYSELTGQQVKFIFILTAELDRYLSYTAYEKRKHKSQIVRDAIEKLMSSDKQYISYLNQS